MAVKIENKATIKLPRKTEETIQSAFDVIPKEHLRGLNKIVLVDRVMPDSRLPIPNAADLPGLYHPKQGNIQPWHEIAVGRLLTANGFFQRIAARLNFRPSLAFVVFSLQAQHYHLNMTYGIKKHQLETSIRTYAEKHHQIWRERQAGWRAKLFKPLRPLFEKLARRVQKWQRAEQKRKSA